VPAPARCRCRSSSARRKSIEPIVQRIAQSHGVNAALLSAIIEVESGFNANALSPKGAVGLMQVMPATAARYGRFNLYSPEQNVDVGARYLRDLLAMFDGNVRLAVAAYNAGENAVIRHGRRVPPYQETIKYVPMVLERYDRFRAGGTH
jgi:soluble lytic murein transglycosylase-like protein